MPPKNVVKVYIYAFEASRPGDSMASTLLPIFGPFNKNVYASQTVPR
jgi:hypothetical protein